MQMTGFMKTLFTLFSSKIIDNIIFNGMPVFCFPLFSYHFILGPSLFFSFSFLFVFCFRAYNAVHHIFRSLLNAWKCSESMPVHFDTQYDQDHSQNILILLTTKSSAKAEKYLALNLSKLNIFTFSLPTQSTNSEYNFLPHISGKAGRIITSC